MNDRRWLLQLAHAARVRGPDARLHELPWRDGAILAWLAIEGPTARARLAALLWPESTEEAARNSLRQRLFQLRRITGTELVVGSHTLALADGVEHDLAEADGLLGEQTAEVTGEFAAWLGSQRERRRDRVRRALAEKSQAAEQAKDWDSALALAREVLALEPLSEEAHRRLVRLHYLAGDRAAALLAFDRLEDVLKNEVGAKPSRETLALLATIESSGALAETDDLRRVPASVLRPPRLVGRERELVAMAQAWQSGQVVALVGEAGMGKTRLLQEFVARHRHVVGCAARPGDAGVPMSSIARLVRAIVSAAAPGSGETAAQQAIASVLPEWSRAGLPAAAGDLQRLAVLRGLRSLLADRPAIRGVFVDDLHFADTASLELLRTLVDETPDAEIDDRGDRPNSGRDGDAARIDWLFAYRPVEAAAGSPLTALLDGWIEQGRWAAIAVVPLTEPALAELVDSLALPGVDGRTLAPGLLRRTGGNPLFVLETLKQAWTERTLDRIAGDLPKPLSVMRLIEHRLTQLSPPALALARCAAIAGQSFTPALAARVLDANPLALADAWNELERAQIVRDRQFAHDLYHEAALASVPQAIARHLHGEVAAQLERAGDGMDAAAPATLAHHWLAADRPERAVPHLEAAARAAREALDPALAARFLGTLAHARQATGAEAAAFEAAHEAVTTLAASQTGTALESAIERLARLARTAEQRAIVQEELGGMYQSRGDRAAAAEAVAKGLAELGPDGSANRRIKLLNLQGNMLRRDGKLPQARASLEQALALVRVTPGTTGHGDLAPVLNNLALVLQEMDEHLTACGLLQEAAGVQTDPLLRARVLNNLGISLEERGQLLLAYEQRLAAARMCAAGQSEGVADLNLAISLGANARNLARFRDAIAHLERAERIGAKVPHFRRIDLYRQFFAVWLELGRQNQARQAIEQAVAASDDPDKDLTLNLVRIRLLVASGGDCAELIARTERALRESNELRMLRRLLVVKAQVSPPADAAASMSELLQSPTLQSNAGAAIPCHVRLAQALLAQGEPQRAERHARRAADALDMALPLDMSCAEVWLTLARVLDAVGDTEGAGVATRRGRQWVEDVVANQVDEPYRDGYLHRNPVNRDLLMRR